MSETDYSRYIVFDIETNGLKAKEDDILSISFYKPDTNEMYNRFLPLELSRTIRTTHINGITSDDLRGAKPLTQDEFDEIAEKYELYNRTILIFCSRRGFDDLFLQEYMKRHRIKGFENLKFLNFKKYIFSSRYSGGNVTKDNLCRMYGIDNVTDIHSGTNDCILEWELFKRIDGHYLLITDGDDGMDNVFNFSDDYIIPVSYLHSHPSLGNAIKNRPYIEFESQVVKEFTISAEGIKKFQTNFNGMNIEHLINVMLNVDVINSREFLLENKKKLEFIGKIPSAYDYVPMMFNSDGTVTAIRESDKELMNSINDSMMVLKERLIPLVEYIKSEIFAGERVKSQELVVDYVHNILSLCDLSSDDAVLEIKTNNIDIENYKEQLYYESRGRRCFHMGLRWCRNDETFSIESLVFIISEVFVKDSGITIGEWKSNKRELNRIANQLKLQKLLGGKPIRILDYTNTITDIYVECLECGRQWNTTYQRIMSGSIKCEKCNPKIVKPRKSRASGLTEEQKLQERFSKYKEKLYARSNGTITVDSYTSAKDNLNAKCNVCGYQWSPRADHLIDRVKCPCCNKRTKK